MVRVLSDKEPAEANAEQNLADAYTYLTRPAVARVAEDGTVLVFRQLSDTTAMYEFYRDGKPGSSSCTGTMSNSMQTFRSLVEYADYVVSNYNGSLEQPA